MASKRIGVASGKVKKDRKLLSVAQKLDIIKRLDRGERSKDICAAFNLSSSTVRSVYLQKDKLQDVAESSVSGALFHRTKKSRNAILEQVEKLLLHWIDSHARKHSTLPFNMIQEQALSLFSDLKRKAEDEGNPISVDFDFKASHGWFERFKKRADLQSIKVSGEKESVDLEAASPFPAELQKIIDEGGYSPKQIINVDETGLFWKRMPSRTFISREEKQASGFKVSKERLSLLLGGNLEGDLKLKPLLVYYSQNPRALEGILKTKLPVLWYWNNKAWVDSQIFMHYLSTYLSPLIEKYCAKNNLENKALLILDNAPGHPKNIEDIESNIRAVFLPPNTTSFLQPMDQGIIAAFKAYYLQLVMRYIVSGLDSDDDANIKQLWKNYNIKMAIDNIGLAWEKVPQQCMNVCWKNLLPKMVYDSTSFKEVIDDIQDKIVQLSKEAGFDEVDKEDVEDVLASHVNELTNEELIQLLKGRPKELDEDPDEISEVKVLDTKTLAAVFNLANEMCNLLQDNDPNRERSSAFKREMDVILACYHELYRAKKAADKQTALDAFFRPKSAESQPSTSAAGPSDIDPISTPLPPPS
jgi:hypothetical protein